MIVYTNLEQINIKSIKRSVVTVGMFDGVHKGHIDVLLACVRYAKNNNIKSIAITFTNHPNQLFNPLSNTTILTTFEEKVELMAKTGIDILVAIPFDFKISNYTASTFIDEILKDKLQSIAIVFGYDNHFGKNRQGSKQFLLDNYGEEFDTLSVSENIIMGDVVSSSRIKNLLIEGNVGQANLLLGYNYNVEGEIIHGNALGRTIGFPTANINIGNDSKLIPRAGVYVTKSTIITDSQKVYYGITNVGIRPTVSEDNIVRVETHILDFDQDIYGSVIKTEFLAHLRDEKKFNSLVELKSQIALDENNARLYLTQIHVTP